MTENEIYRSSKEFDKVKKQELQKEDKANSKIRKHGEITEEDQKYTIR